MEFKEIAYNSPVISFGAKKDFIKVDEIESGLLHSIHTGDPLISGFGEIKDMKQINEGFLYDTFCLDFEDNRKIVKISYVTGYDVFRREQNAIQALPTGISGLSLVSPTIISSQTGTIPNYLCTTFENGFSFENLDNDDLSYNLVTFCNTLDAIHESDPSSLPTIKDKIDIDNSITGVYENDPEFDFATSYYFGLGEYELSKILKINTEYINEHYKSDLEVFSNFDIKKSSILYKSDMIKIINFEHSYKLDLFLSLQKTIYSIGYGYAKNYKINFLKQYFKNSNLVSEYNENSFLNEYFDREKHNAIVIANDLISRHIFLLSTDGTVDLEKFHNHYEIYKQIKVFLNELHPNYAKNFEEMFMYAFPNYDLKRKVKI